MKIESNQYEVASLPPSDEALRIIQEAEQKLHALAGDPITLIAYAKTESEDLGHA